MDRESDPRDHPEIDAKVEALARKFIFFNLHLNQNLMIGAMLQDHLTKISRVIDELQADLAKLGPENVRVWAKAELPEAVQNRLADALFDKAPDTIPEDFS